MLYVSASAVSNGNVIDNFIRTITCYSNDNFNDIRTVQTNIFGEIELQGLTIDQVAKAANVSSATIRNWIKTGYLTLSGKGLVSQESLQSFISNVAGKEKLNSRANKSLKDGHDHKKISEKISLLVSKGQGESIGIEYESSLSNSYRNKEGIYYTPSWVVRDMFEGVQIKRDYTFLDPCCGSGNFIIEAIKRGISPENVYGFDVDENAIFITKKRIKDEFGYEANNIKVGNFLHEVHRISREHVSFDLIFTNPPWGKKIEKSEKESYAAMYNCGNSIDTTSLFLGASLSVLRPNGFLGFLIQEAFFNIGTFEDIRKRVVVKKVLRFNDYGRAFKGLLTKAQAIILENRAADTNQIIECRIDGVSFGRSLQSFIVNPKHIFNFWTNEDEAQVIKQLYSVKHTILKNKAKWALGIVTGNNDRFCSDEPLDGYVPIYKGSDITKVGLKKPGTYILNKFANFQQVAPLEMYQAKEKIVYKFISSDLCFCCDKQQKYILNSANLLIPLNVGVTAEQLTSLLNSEVINWLFKKLFATHKVLRGDLELLPIHIDYFSKHQEFTEAAYLNFLHIAKTDNGTYRVKD
jgi:site-specific DNA-methyltransferase (adenine-specific)